MRNFWFCNRILVIFIFGTFLFSTLSAFFEEIVSVEQGDSVKATSFNKDTTLLAVGGGASDAPNLFIYEFDGISVDEKYKLSLPGSPNDALAIAWQNTKNILAVGRVTTGSNGALSVYEWDGSKLVEKSNIVFPSLQTNTVDWAPDGTLLAVGTGSDILIYRWDGSTLTCLQTLNLASVQCLSWNPDGEFLAGVGGGIIRIYQRNSSSNTLELKVSLNDVATSSVKWSPTTNKLAVGGSQIVKVYSWDKTNFVLTLDYTQRFESALSAVNGVIWDGFEGYLVAEGYDNVALNNLVAYKWDATVSNSLSKVDGVKLNNYAAPSSPLYMSWNFDSLYLAIGYRDTSGAGKGIIKVFKTQTAYDQGKTINSLTVGPVVRYVSVVADVVASTPITITVPGIEVYGNGYTITFQPGVQFIVDSSADVTLYDIALSGLTQDTFDLQYRQRQRQRSVEDVLDDDDETREVINNVDVATLYIGNDVNFDLSQDCVLQSGLIQFRQRQRQRSISETSYLNITGVDGNQSFILDPSDEFLNALRQRQRQRQRPALAPDVYMFDMTDGTLNLQDAGLQGTTNIRQRQRIRSLDFGEFGTIILDGNAEVLVGDSFRQRQRQRQRNIKIENENLRITQNVQVQPECGLDFIISGEGNKISMLDDNTLFTGQLVFASTGVNSLEMRSELTSAIVNPTDDPNRTIPQMGFGANFMNMTSLDGTAKLIFSDPRIRVDNEPNGFLIGQNSTLIGNGVEIYGDSIRYQYDPLTESAPLRLAVKNLTASSEIYNVPLIPVLPLLSFSQIQNLMVEKNDLEGSGKEESEKSIIRQIGANVISYYRETIDLGQAQGNVVLDQTTANNFSVHSTEYLNLTLKNGSVLVLKDESVTLKSEDGKIPQVADVINIVGKNNIIYVPNIFTITGDLIFEAGAELKIVSLNPNAKIFWGNFVGGQRVFHNPITLQVGSTLSFSDPGTVVLGDLEIKLNGLGSELTTRPLLIFENNIKVRAYTTLKIYGIGDVRNENAYLDLTNSAPSAQDAGAVYIGNSELDNINFINNGIIHLRGIPKLLQGGRPAVQNSYNGTLSFIAGESKLVMMPEAVIDVDEYGILAINIKSFNDVSTINPGNFKGIFLSPKGQLSIKPKGKIVLAENKDAFDPIDKKFMMWQADGTVTFDGADSLGNTGIIEYISPNSTFNFAGQMLFSNGNFSASDLSAQELARRLINRSSVLKTAAQVLGANNVGWIRLKSGMQIQMQSGDTILEENPDGSVRGKDASGKNIIFTLTSVRQVVA